MSTPRLPLLPLPLLLFSFILPISFALRQELPDIFIKDVLTSQETDQCDLNYVTDHTNLKMTANLVAHLSQEQRYFTWLEILHTFSKSTNFSYPRAFVIHTASLEVERVFITESKCIVHFLDVDNITIAKNYLKHAWYAGLLGPNNIHVVNIEYSTYDPMELMFPEIFDFQKLFIAEHRVKLIAFTSIRIIWRMLHIGKYEANNGTKWVFWKWRVFYSKRHLEIIR